MATEKIAKFVQIAVSLHPKGHGVERQDLYALDAAGTVWRFSEGEGRWHRVPMERD
jgi:hypothetical protein